VGNWWLLKKASAPWSYSVNIAAITKIVSNYLQHAAEYLLCQNHILEPFEKQNIVVGTQCRDHSAGLRCTAHSTEILGPILSLLEYSGNSAVDDKG
jgi:hypothetical protein